MLRVTQRVGQSGDLKSGLPTPSPILSLGLLARDLRTYGVPTACLVAQTSLSARASQVVLETDTNHKTTLSSFGRRCGREEHSGGVFAWLSRLKTKPLPSWELGQPRLQPWVTSAFPELPWEGRMTWEPWGRGPSGRAQPSSFLAMARFKGNNI